MRNLVHSSLFAGIPLEKIRALVEPLPKKTVKAKEIIIEQGAKGNTAYILISGKVEVFYTAKNDRRATLIFHQAPFIFGEFEIWSEMPYLASVQASEKCELLVLKKGAFLSLLNTSHQFSINLIKTLSQVFVQIAESRRVENFGAVTNLVANTLCSLAQLYGDPRAEGILIRKEISQADLAKIVGTSRKSVIQSLNTLIKSNFIEKEGKYYYLPDLARLQNFALSF